MLGHPHVQQWETSSSLTHYANKFHLLDLLTTTHSCSKHDIELINCWLSPPVQNLLSSFTNFTSVTSSGVYGGSVINDTPNLPVSVPFLSPQFLLTGIPSGKKLQEDRRYCHLAIRSGENF